MNDKVLIGSIFAIAMAFSSPESAHAQEAGRMQYGVKGSFLGIYMGSHYTSDFTAGWRFNNRHYLGGGTGCHWIEGMDKSDPFLENGIVPAIPLYADYTSYFQFKKNQGHSFYLGCEAGAAFYPGKLPMKNCNDRVTPYLNAKLGLDFTVYRNFGLNFGLNVIFSEGSGLGLNVGVRF